MIDGYENMKSKWVLFIHFIQIYLFYTISERGIKRIYKMFCKNSLSNYFEDKLSNDSQLNKSTFY